MGEERGKKRVEPKIIDPDVLREMIEELRQTQLKSLGVFRPRDPSVINTDGMLALKLIVEKLPPHNNAVKENPESAMVYLKRGRLFQYYGEALQYAIDDFTRAIELAASDPEASSMSVPYVYTLRGSCLSYRSLGYTGSSKPQRGDYEKAIADFDKALELDPNYRMAYYERGDCYEYHGEMEKAKRDFEKLLSITESNLKEATDPQEISDRKYYIATARERLEKLEKKQRESK